MNKFKKAVMAAALCAVQLVTAVTFTTSVSAAVTDAKTDTVAVGANHTLVIKSDNSLWGSGKNDFKQLSSVVTEEFSTKPVKIMSNVISIDAGGNSSFAIDKNNDLYAWGENDNGLINTQSYDTIATPTKVLSNVASVSASDTHVLAVTQNGELYAWGSNLNGELGYSISGNKNQQKKIMDNVLSASAGSGFSLVVTTDGALYSFGKNENGQLGLGSFTNQYTPKMALKSDVSMAAAGKNHSLILLSNGTVYAAGLNEFGQLGINSYSDKSSFVQTSLSDIKYVFAGGNSSGALSQKNNLYTWGENTSGQLHNGKTDNETKPCSITTGIISFAVSDSYSIVLKNNGTLSTAGLGIYGELMEATSSSVKKPVLVGKGYESFSAGKDHMVAIDISGNLFTWGANTFGQLGTGDYNIRIAPTKITLPNNDKALEVWAGNGFTFVRTIAGVYYCFGNNSSYQLGMITKTNTVNKPTENIELTGTGAELSLATDHVLALYGGSVYGWGRNSSATLSTNVDIVKTPTIISDQLSNIYSISAGDYHSLALDRDGLIWAWGSNTSGQLAIIAAKQIKIPEAVPIKGTKYVTVGGVKEKQEYDVIFSNVKAAGTHTIAVDSEGKLWAWGSNSYGQVGTSTSRITTPLQINSTAYKLVTSETASAVITLNDKLYFSGKNSFGRFGIDSDKDLDSFSTLTASNVTSVGIGEEYTAYLLNDGSLYTCGNNTNGQLGNNEGGIKLNPTAVLTECLTVVAKADSIKLDKTELTVKPGATAVITATVLPAEVLDKTVIWKSSDASIATVTNGTVKGIANGTATITATTKDGTISSSCKVTVATPPTLISVTRTKKSMVQTQTYQITAKVLPATATNKNIVYKSSNDKVATVSSTGLVNAIAAGTAVITVSAEENSDVFKTVTITVTPCKTKITSKTSTTKGITINWSNIKNITGYEIYRKVTKSGTYKLVDDLEDVSTYLDSNVTKGKAYYYKIKTYTIVDGVKVYGKFCTAVGIRAK